jgi:hypothetical protein
MMFARVRLWESESLFMHGNADLSVGICGVASPVQMGLSLGDDAEVEKWLLAKKC